jgi:PPM family protein phosphatase
VISSHNPPPSHPCTALSEAFEPGISFAELTDIGMRRTNNQDSLVCVPARSASRFLSRGHLFIVADGMGAHAAGELASRMATDQFVQHYSRLSETELPPVAISEALSQTNRDIFQRGQNNPEFHNMGTTASALVLTPTGATIGHVGDSRVYRLRGNVLQQYTFDHSLIWEMQASGQVTAENLGRIPKNVITRSLGPSPEVRVDIEGPIDVLPGDQFLLCSDGLTGQVDDEEIATLMACLPESMATRVLIDLANLRGGPDNTSVIIVRITADLQAAKANSKGPEGNATIGPVLWGTTGLCFLGALLLALLQMWGPMIVAFALGVIAAAVSAVILGRANQPKKSNLLHLTLAGGDGPYRQYKVAANAEMFDRLGKTVDALREAAKSSGWHLNWNKVDQLQSEGKNSKKQGSLSAAIRFQAEAIIETMNQLRDQNNRAAGETAADGSDESSG